MFFNIFFQEIKWIFLRQKLKKVELLILDVDGVLTDGYLYYDYQGNQIKRFSVKDGLGIRYLQKAGLNICIVSGGKEDVIKNRAKDLNIQHIYCGVKNKKEKVEFLRDEFKVKKDNILYLGDDLNDLTVRKSVGLLIAPNNASKNFKKYCNAILKNNGGFGAVRELAERLLRGTKLLRSIEKEGFSELNI
jgi:3-deoxy-D-manno-octulosonate 8-phosphate phosphatase (KDO 8-P phosphatase)